MSDAYTSVHVDFNSKTGTLRHALHSDGHTPNLASRFARAPQDQDFLRMNFYAARTHDWALSNAGQRIVDTHFIFPLMHLDPADPQNYYFEATDAIIKLCHNVGMKVFYRLGTSIEHSAGKTPDDYCNHYNTHPPKDNAKYAEVLAGIVRHYTRKWANGFEYKDMLYWEIWNEPDVKGKMWCGTDEEFIEFFVTVLKRLKAEFPELKIGGPALTTLKLDYFAALLDACDAAGVKPDFISWHRYSCNVQEMVEMPFIARKFLDERNLQDVELCINEWHYLPGSWDGVQATASFQQRMRVLNGPCGMHGIDSGCFNLCTMCGWQDSPLDSAFYYGHGFNTWSYYDEYNRPSKNYYSMEMFGRYLAEAKEKVKAEYDKNGTVYASAAFANNGKDGKMVISDYRGSKMTLEVDVSGMEDAEVYATVLDNDNDIVPAQLQWDGKHLSLVKPTPGSAAFYVTFTRR